VLHYFTHSITTKKKKPLLTAMNVSWKHTAHHYLYSNNFPTCAIHITKIYCDIHTRYGSSNFITFCSNEAGWNTDSSCQNIKNIFVLAWGIIGLQIIYRTSAELKPVGCINDWQVEVYDIPNMGIISVCWLQCKWLPACLPDCHTVALSLMILHKTAYHWKTEWHLKHTISVVWRE